MSTKNLARTIIEGGRAPYNKWERAYSHGQERALTRAYFTDALREEEGFDTHVVGTRPKVYRGFADKLGAPRRWLRSHLGRPWNKVCSEMFEHFDPRTLAGQHIIFDHLLAEVRMWADPTERYHWRSGFFVDAHGVLREEKRRPRRVQVVRGKRRHNETEVRTWIAGRKVGGQGETLHWFVLARACGQCADCDDGCCCPWLDGKQHHGAHEHYRQDDRLSKDERSFWYSLLEHVQAEHRFPRAH